MTRNVAKYYVLGIEDTPWVLGPIHTLPLTKVEAERAVAWQGVGGSPDHHWAICTYDPETSQFVSINGRRFTVVGPGIYTQKAWTDFLARLPQKKD